MNALVFGAGNIGRGFLGALLTQSGFSITFVDVDETKTTLLNQLGEYPITTVSAHGTETSLVHHVRGIASTDQEAIARAVVEADVILTAVGKDALRLVAPVLSLGLLRRIKERPRDETHVVVIACENVNDNTAYLQGLIENNLEPQDSSRLSRAISFPNCVVDRIVPNISDPRATPHPLAVTVEEYFQFVVDRTVLRAPFPAITGVELSDDLSSILEQKLFTLNMAHAIVGYYGYLRGCQFIHEAVADPDVALLLNGALEEVGTTITERHPTIPVHAQRRYAEKVVHRFQNAHLRDAIVRVARQPKRKLGAEDRLVKPALLTRNQGRVPAYLATGIAAALHYDHAGDIQAQELVSEIRQKGITRVLHEVSGLAPNDALTRLVQSDFLLRSL